MKDNWVAYNGMKMPEELKGKKVKIQIRGVSRVVAEKTGTFWAAESFDWTVERDNDAAIVCYLVEEEPTYIWINEYKKDRCFRFEIVYGHKVALPDLQTKGTKYFGFPYTSKDEAIKVRGGSTNHLWMLKLRVVEEEE